MKRITKLKREFMLNYLMILGLLFFCTNGYSYNCNCAFINESIVVVKDTIPLPATKTIIQSDTISTFDYDTYVETVEVVKTEVEVIELIDTVIVFDPESGKETISIIKTDIPLDEYKENVKAYNKLTREESGQEETNILSIDTIVMFDYENYEETTSIIERVNPCYTFFWGNGAMSTSHEYSPSYVKSFLYRKIRLSETYHKECGKVESYSCRVVFIPKGKDPKIVVINSENNTIGNGLIPEDYIISGTKIFIEDIKVNEEVAYKSIVITIK